MPAFSYWEQKIRTEVREAFPGCKIYCRRDRGRFVARIDIVNGSWCSARGDTRDEAIAETFELAREPAPGFPGWVEPAESDELGELALT
jgi:hypothetical protein